MRATKRLVSMLLALAMVFSLVPATLLGAAAQDDPAGVEYLYYTDGSTTPNVGTADSNLHELDADTTTLDGGWYVAVGEQTISQLTLNGDTHLILTNGCTLTVTGGIRITNGNYLSIYAQPEEEGKDVGKLFATGGAMCSGIGSRYQETCGDITIHGGEIHATGDTTSPGIGAGSEGAAGAITIYDGEVYASAGKNYAAGIGGGEDSECEAVTIYGGHVEANGGKIIHGIGGGIKADAVLICGGEVIATASENGSSICGNAITVNGGEITASSYGACAAIGDADSQIVLNDGKITLSHTNDGRNFDGSVTVTTLKHMIDSATSEPIWKSSSETWTERLNEDDVSSIEFAANEEIPYLYYIDGNPVPQDDGTVDDYTVLQNDITELLDGWYVLDHDVTVDVLTVSGDVHLILEDGCTLTANEGVDVEDPNSLTVYAQSEDPDVMGKLIAYGGGMESESTPAIGTHSKVSCGTITIHGGDVLADATGCSASGIGCAYRGYKAPQTTSGTLTVYGGKVTALGGTYSAGIGGSMGGKAGTVIINGGEVTATGGFGAAGIGGGYIGMGGIVTINGGLVTATGDAYFGAGIGGASRSSGTITINGGEIHATANGSGAGIGGGFSYTCDTVTINGGEIYAYSESGSAIGAGARSDGSLYYTNQVTGIVGNTVPDGTVWGDVTVNGGRVTVSHGENGKNFEADVSFPDDTVPADVETNTAFFKNTGEFWMDRLNANDVSTFVLRQINGDIPYLYYEDGDAVPTSGTCYDGDYTFLRDAGDTLGDGWYVADVSSGLLEVTGDAHLILLNYSTVNIRGIHVAPSASITIYAQSEEQGAMGVLVVDSRDTQHPGIGGGGDVTIHGGTITAYGGERYAGIGSGDSVTIHGGTVTAYGGLSSPGIGGGTSIVTINGGTVTAYGRSRAAGIGDGFYTGNGAVTINGGTVTAYGGDFSAGIGNAFNSENDCTVTINGGTVNAYGGGAGFNGDDGGDGIGGIVTINDGNVTALAGDGGCGLGGTVTVMGGQVETAGKYTGAGIGGGNVTIHGGKVTAFGGSQGAGINCGGTLSIKNNVSVGATGCGDCDGIYAKEIFIHGGTVTAYGGSQGAGIYCDGKLSITNNVTIDATGCGDADGIYATEMRMYSGTLTAQGGTNGNGINIKWNSTLGGSSVTATGHGTGAGVRSYNSVEVTCGTFTATGGENGPGIFCADLTLNANEAKVTGGTGCAGIQSDETTIIGGTVMAQGGEGGAGIGGENKTITIYRNSVVTATGGKNAVGIGGTGTKVSIFGNSDVTAVGGEGGAGIGCSKLSFTGGYITAKGGSGADAIRVPNYSITIGGTGMTLTHGEGGQNFVATSINLINNTYLKDSVTGNVISKRDGQSLLARLNESDVTSFTVESLENTPYLYYESGSTEAQPGTVPAGYNMVNTSMTVLSGWNIVYDNLTLETLTVSGDAHLILMDGVTLTVNDRIIVENGAGLSVYAQTQDPDVMGSLVVYNNNTASRSAAIGGSDGNACGTVTIHGGHVQANGKAYGAAVIGGGYCAGGGTITVYDGIVEAIGANNTHGMGAGNGVYESTGTVTINGGTVTVTGKNGINASNVTISGGVINATGGNGSAAIGADRGSVALNGGVINLTHGQSGVNFTGTVTVAAGTAIKDNTTGGMIAPAAGQTWNEALSTATSVTVLKSSAVPYLYYSAEDDAFLDGTTGADTQMIGPDTARLVNGWYVVAADVTLDELTIFGNAHLVLMNGATLTVNRCISVGDGNSLSVYAQTQDPDTMGTLVVENSTLDSAAIGSLSAEDCGTVTIHGGHIQASGKNGCAVIGGGSEADGGTVIIHGGVVEATGKSNTPAIGAGCDGSAGTVIITGGTVTATSSGQNAINAANVTITGGNIDASGSETGSAILSGAAVTVSPREGYVIFVTDENETVITGSSIASETDISSLVSGKTEIHVTTLAVYHVTVEEAENGTAQTDLESAVAGDVVTLTATPDEGYILVGWESEDVTVGADGTFTMPEKDVTVTPVFAKVYQKAHIVTAPTVAQNGTYNRHEYYLDTDGNPVVTKENVWDEANSVDFGTWFLRTMVQYKAGDDGAHDVRLISMLDEHLDEYMEAGFFLTVGGEEIDPISTTVANKSFLAAGNTVSIGQYSREQDHFFLQNVIFAADAVDDNTVITAQPYVTLMDGETIVKGAPVSFTIGQLKPAN